MPIATLGKVFLFFLFLFTNFFCGIYTLLRSTCSNLKLFYDLLVYFLIFYVYLNFRHRTSQLARKPLNFLSQPLHVMTRHLDKFRDFRTLFAFYIIKKNTFLISWWSCFVKLMFKISRMSLHTASKYTQKHEYHFFNR